MNTHSIWAKLDRYPPVVVRCLAVVSRGNGRRLMTDIEIARSSGIPLILVKEISLQSSWDFVHVHRMRSFVKACGMDFADANRMRSMNRLLKGGFKFDAARKSPDWNKYLEVLRTLA